MAHVNDQPVNDLPNNPFGGEKNSGIGRFGDGWAVEAFTTDQWVTLQHLPREFPCDGCAIRGSGPAAETAGRAADPCRRAPAGAELVFIL